MFNTILSATDPAFPFGALIIPLLLAVGAATAVAIRLFKPGSIVGPSRVEPNEPLEPLAIAMGLGMMVYFLAIAFAMGGGSSTTRPATEPVLTEAGVLVELLARVGGIAVIFFSLLLFYRGTRRLGMSPDRLPYGIAAGAVGMLIVIPILFVVIAATSMAMGPKQQYIHPFLKMLSSTGDEAGRDVILVSILAAAPISEELLFRVCLQTLLLGWMQRLKTEWPAARIRWLAIFFTSILFALAHGEPWAMPPIFMLSLCLGYAYERTGNIWASITIHAAFNGWQLWMYEMMK